MLMLKKIAPTRMVKNQLFQRVAEAENRGAEADELREIMGAKASKRGIFEGDVENGELEIGQIASAVHEILPVAEIFDNLMNQYRQAKRSLIDA